MRSVSMINETLFCPEIRDACSKLPFYKFRECSGFSWDRVNFAPSNCCDLDLAQEEC